MEKQSLQLIPYASVFSPAQHSISSSFIQHSSVFAAPFIAAILYMQTIIPSEVESYIHFSNETDCFKLLKAINENPDMFLQRAELFSKRFASLLI